MKLRHIVGLLMFVAPVLALGIAAMGLTVFGILIGSIVVGVVYIMIALHLLGAP